jgi:hypothetical protein
MIGWWNMSNNSDYKTDCFSEADFLTLQMMQRSPRLAKARVRYFELAASKPNALQIEEMKRLRKIMGSEAYALGWADGERNVE